MGNGVCYHVHGDEGMRHESPMVNCEEHIEESCDFVPHGNDRCPFDAQDPWCLMDHGEDKICALGQPIGGTTWLGKPGCQCEAGEIDYGYYEAVGPQVKLAKGRVKRGGSKIFPSKFHFCR